MESPYLYIYGSNKIRNAGTMQRVHSENDQDYFTSQEYLSGSHG